MNTGASWPSLEEAAARVLGMQTKLHRWAGEDGGLRFDDLYNLVSDPAFLVVAWSRVKGNTGARSAGVDGETVRGIEAGRGAEAFLRDLRADLKAGAFRPLPVRERMIPKSGGRLRRLGIPTALDRVVQRVEGTRVEGTRNGEAQTEHAAPQGDRPGPRSRDLPTARHPSSLALTLDEELREPLRRVGKLSQDSGGAFTFSPDAIVRADLTRRTAYAGDARRR